MRTAIAILSIGSELLDGRVHETNAHYVAQQLSERPLPLAAVATCDDDEREIHDALNYLSQRASFIIVSGGLGPTTDDLTREAIASFSGCALEQRPELLEWLKQLFAERRRTFDPTNTKQASIPRGAAVIPNPIGTAAGFFLRHPTMNGEILIAALPGVPREFKVMYEKTVAPLIDAHVGAAEPRDRRVFRLFGLPEAVIGGMIERLMLPPAIAISYRAAFPEIQVILKAASSAHTALDEAAARVEECFGNEPIFSRELEGSFEETILKILRERKRTFACAESCTGGMLGSLITSVPGASESFLGAVVPYANSAKSGLLAVPDELLRAHGAVSSEAAISMARGTREYFNADIAISITGIAGPGGGSDDKPVGTFYVGYSDETYAFAVHLFYASSRNFVRRFASFAALDVMRRRLLGYPLSTYGFEAGKVIAP